MPSTEKRLSDLEAGQKFQNEIIVGQQAAINFLSEIVVDHEKRLKKTWTLATDNEKRIANHEQRLRTLEQVT